MIWVESIDAVEHFRGVVSATVGRMAEVHSAARMALSRVLMQTAEALAAARQRVDECREELRSAQADLARCESRREDDKESDCDAEVAAVESAEASLLEAERRLDQATRSADRIGEAGDVLEAQTARVEDWITSAFPGLDSAIFRSVEQLRCYASAGPSGLGGDASASSRSVGLGLVPGWYEWQPSGDRHTVMPADILGRFRLIDSELRDVTAFMAVHDDVFRQEVLRRRRDYAAAQGAADKDAVYLQTIKSCSGLWGNRFSKLALSPFAGEVVTERYVAEAEGNGRRGTVTDLVLKDLRFGFVIGRGAGAGAPRGGSISVEVKTGQKEYIYSELQHMKRQVQGHAGEFASLCLVSKDFKDLPKEKQGEFRASLHSAGSRVFAVLPRKEMIDQLCWERVCTVEGET